MNLNDFNKIKKVEVPPFLFSRIQQKIKNISSDTLTKKTSWALGLSFIAIVCLNIGLIVISQNSSQSIEKYAQSINLTSPNTFYK